MATSTDPKWLGVIQILGAFGEQYAKYCTHKLEIKKLQQEADVLLAQINSANLRIEASLEYELAKINERKVLLSKALEASIKEMELIHAERMEYIKIFRIMSEASIDSSKGQHEREFAREGLKEIRVLMDNAGEKGKVHITVLHESTRKALEAIPSASHLLVNN